MKILSAVSTLVQIESAVVGLPMQDQWTLLAWLQGRLKEPPKIETATPEALKVFRKLQAEVALTAEAAVAWKASVENSRR